ncbi:MAG TPA: DUF1844 domain-containing protein [Phycisphaerae bacterium]|nr:DUF1844 domain-containing protein [Phycisphaerae bacterium]HRY66974.1 DUF1844 domain-containing protein [Phycisphaerae bacterium]HSA29560.1 DUF1844 domain-containing protein [Phycisphaerae bacterium]
MPDPNNEQPKIIVDDDWKAQAQREKEEADRQTREHEESGSLPAAHLAEIVQMIALQASVGLGLVTDPRSGQPIPPDLAVAKHFIDLLTLFRQKTGDKLDDVEKKIVEGTLYELQMAFVHVAGGGPAGGDQETSPK